MLPWVPEVFVRAAAGFFGVDQKPTDLRQKGEAVWGFCKDLTETGNRALKVSSTQGTNVLNWEKRFMTSNLPKLSASGILLADSVFFSSSTIAMQVINLITV